MIWGAVVVAAGRGTRFGRPKQLLELAGRPVLGWSVALFAGMPEIVDLVIVSETEFIEETERVAAVYAARLAHRVIAGGTTRQESVRRGVSALPSHCAAVLVHDGARPLVQAEHVRAGMRIVRPGRAALLAAPVIDTIKVVDAQRTVTGTLDRATLWAAQTPQFAATRDLARVHAEALALGWPSATDDAALLERGGIGVTVVESSVENFKLTYAGDLPRAEAILRSREAKTSAEPEVLVLECFVAARSVNAVLAELESRAARVDGIDRDLPAAVAIRAHIGREDLRGFGRRLEALAGEDALFTTHAHVAS